TSSTGGSGARSRRTCAPASRRTFFPTPRKYAFLGNGFVVVQVEPALDDPVDDPDRVRGEDEPADHGPEQPPPEGADLPAEVRLEPGAFRLVALHVVDHDGHDPGDSHEEAS